MKKNKKKVLPCHTCGHLGLSCCSQSFGILWRDTDLNRLAEFLNKTESFNKTMEKIDVYKQKVPGFYALIKKTLTKTKNDENTEDTCCPFYDLKIYKCTIYKARPDLCREYGTRPPCPYENWTPIKLINKNKQNREKCLDLASETTDNYFLNPKNSSYQKEMSKYSSEVTKDPERLKNWATLPAISWEKNHE